MDTSTQTQAISLVTKQKVVWRYGKIVESRQNDIASSTLKGHLKPGERLWVFIPTGMWALRFAEYVGFERYYLSGITPDKCYSDVFDAIRRAKLST